MAKQSSPSSPALVLLAILSVTLTSIPSVTGYGRIVGGRKQVMDVEANKEVQELGKFCVEEFNDQLRRHGENGGELEFSEVVAAQVQVVAGIKYFLNVKATTEEGKTRVYDSVVVVKPWLGHEHSKKLLKFAPSTKVLYMATARRNTN